MHLEKKVLSEIETFIEKYGSDSLIAALQDYDLSHQLYTCKTKCVTTQVPICSIDYIEIYGHEIIIHTTNGNFRKYGTLSIEYNRLKKYGFVKCNQSYLIPISKIIEIRGKNVKLTTGDSFPLSRSCATEVIQAYVKNNINK